MRPLVSCILAALSIFSMSEASGQQWTTFRSPSDGFSIAVPASPVSTATGFSPDTMARMHKHLIELNSRAFLVQVVQYKHGARAALANDEALPLLVEALKGKCDLRDQHSVTIANGVAIEATYDNCLAGMVHRNRFYLVGDWFYLTGVLGPAGTDADPDTIRFLDSFKLTPSLAVTSVPNSGQGAAVVRTQSLCSAISKGGASIIVNMTELANNLRKEDFKKREFETTPEYFRRTETQIASVQKSISAISNKEFVFSVPIPNDMMKYDADRGAMAIGRKYSPPITRLDGTTAISYSEIAGESYEAVNGFGTRMTIKKVSAQELLVTIRKNRTSLSKFGEISVPLARDEAKDAKKNLVILLGGKLTSPYFSASQRRTSPTVGFPFDYSTGSETIHTNISCAALYNQANGKIVAQLDLSRL